MSFHETTSTILSYVLAEQRFDLKNAQRRLAQADESTLKTAVERERFPRTVASFRAQIAELTAVIADFERLTQVVADANAAAASIPAQPTPRLFCTECGIGDRETENGLCDRCAEERGAR